MCGVIGLIGKSRVAEELYHGLSQLQHRGQDAAGILTYDAETNSMHEVKARGIVSSVFNAENLKQLRGSWGLGQIRYTTSGDGSDSEAQPYTYQGEGPKIGVVYNGNLVNYRQLRRDLDHTFTSENDVEALGVLIGQAFNPSNDPFEAIVEAASQVYSRVQGAYSVVGVIQGIGMFAFRDPRGIRPLLMARGSEQEEYAFCSETYPPSFLGYQDIENVRPGEVIFVDKEHQLHRRQINVTPRRHCSFEYVYFAKANAELEGQEVYRVRSELGKAIGRKVKDLNLPVDAVIGVPSTSQPAAMAAAWELGIKLEEGFLRKDHSGRSFLLPTPAHRKAAVSQKLAPVKSVFKGKKLLIVDDSIVRGTVSRSICRIARDCGAEAVYFASTFPRIRFACYYGIDIAQEDELLARGRSYEEIAQEIGADCVIFNDIEDLRQAIGLEGLCLACTDGDYPTKIDGSEELAAFRRQHQAKATKGKLATLLV